MAAAPGVLVVDANERSAVAACRTLRAAGYRVGAASYNHPAPGQWSLSCARKHRVSHPRLDQEQFAKEVAEIANDGGYFTLVPGTDASLLAISRHRGAFGEGVDLGLPPADVVEACVSKINLLEVAERAGLGPPETVVCDDVAGVHQAAAELGFPLLLKPRSTVFELDGTVNERASFMAPDLAVLERRLPDFGLPCLVQRYETGSPVSFAGVYAGGRMLGAVFSRYLRVWPPNAGSVSFSETIDGPGSLAERVEAFLAGMGWEGIFELELMERGTERFGAIDFNPRIYGSLALGARAGVHLTSIWCDWLSGREAPARTAPAGFHYRWEDADFRNMLHRLRERRFAAAASVARPSRRCAHAFFRWNDPAPLAARAFDMRRRYRLRRKKRSGGAGIDSRKVEGH